MKCSDETMKEAAQTAQATEFIDAKPEGYDSPVAQGGSNVSGGQKQRLAIARVIAKHPKVYLFDDSFSALDYKTDAALRKALHEQAADATVLIVAQRISTIMNAEQILVLEDGKIVGKGTHEELMKNCERLSGNCTLAAVGKRAERRHSRMSQEQNKKRPMMGHGPGRGMMPGEKAKDFTGTIQKLFAYLEKLSDCSSAVVILFAIGSTVFNIIGPKVLSKVTTELFNGLVSKGERYRRY